jgi:hypothetical protein
MGFGINLSGMKAEVLDQLPGSVTAALKTGNADEQEGIQLIGQVLYFKMSKTDDQTLVDVNANGAVDQRTGEETFVVSVRLRKTPGVVPKPDVKKWDPTQGPLSIAPATTDTAAPDTTATKPAP